MYANHITKSGITIQICDLSDQELKTELFDIFNSITQLKNMLRQKDVQVFDSFRRNLKSTNTFSEGDIQQHLDIIIVKMYPYVAEATIRGMEIKETMQQVFERNSQDKPEGIKHFLLNIFNSIKPKQLE